MDNNFKGKKMEFFLFVVHCSAMLKEDDLSKGNQPAVLTTFAGSLVKA